MCTLYPQVHNPKYPQVHNPKDITASADTSRAEIKKAGSGEGGGKLSPAEGVVFHPVTRGSVKTRFDAADSLRVISPSHDSSTSDCSPLDSLSGSSSDEADEEMAPSSGTAARSATHTRRVIRKHKREKKDQKSVRGVSNSSRENGSTINPSLPPTHINPSLPSTRAGSDSSTDDESTPLRFSSPRTRRQRKLPPGPPPGGHQHRHDEPQEPKIVGILKKPHSGRSVSNTNNRRGEGALFSMSAPASRGCSTANSALTLERSGHGYGLGESQVSRDTITLCSASTTKRVRFSDNLESSLNTSQTSLSSHPAPHTHTVTIDSAVELWRRVLPHEGRSLNGLFSPRMKISLSQRGGGRWALKNKQPQSSTDRITVHVPRAKDAVEDATTNSRVEGEGGVKGQSKNAQELQTREKDGDNLSREVGGSNREVGGSSQDSKTVERDKHVDHYLTPSQSVESTDRGRDDGRVGRDDPSDDESVTDAQIERVWEEIRQLYGRDDRVSVAPQVYKFQPGPHTPGPQNGSTQGEGARRGGGGGGGGGRVRHLPHRQQQRPLRCQGVVQSHTYKTNTTHPHQKWTGPAQQSHHQHHMIHSNSYHQSESSLSSWEPTVTSTAVTKPGLPLTVYHTCIILYINCTCIYTCTLIHVHVHV